MLRFQNLKKKKQGRAMHRLIKTFKMQRWNTEMCQLNNANRHLRYERADIIKSS